MSLPWRKAVHLRIEPGAVSGHLERGAWRPAVLAQAHHAVEGPMATLDPALDALLTELAGSASLKGAQLRVVLADTMLHLDVVAGDFAGDSERQLQAVAEACVAELLGEAAAAHEIRWQLQPDGRHLLIAALGREHLQALREAADRHGLALDSVQPQLCRQWNHHAAALPSGTTVFAVAQGPEALVACVAHGSIAALSQGQQLDLRVDRLLASTGLDPAQQGGYVLVAPQAAAQGASPRWTVLNPAGLAP